jgi:hypothetical protein
MKKFLCLFLCFVTVAFGLPVQIAFVQNAAASAAITRTQNVSAATPSVAISTPTAGDLILVYAHRAGSNTPPTKAPGYTTIVNTTGTNTDSSITAFKFSAGSETDSGTWTNATEVCVLVYRNAGLGGWAQTYTTGSSATATYGTLTMQNTSGSSWVAAFGGERNGTSAPSAPTGMTTRTSQTKAAAHDTGAGVASWSSATAASNGTQGWVTSVVEILAVPSGQLLWTYIQDGANMGFSGAATAAVTMPQSVGAENHVLVVATQYSGSPIEVVSIDKGGTLVPVVATTGAGFEGEGGSFGYVIGTTTATTPITVTYAGTVNGNVRIYELAYTGTGTPSLDFANRSSVSSGTTVAGAAATMTGGNDVVITTASTTNSVTDINAPYKTPTGVFTAPTGNGFAVALNNTSFTAPSWTINTTGNTAVSEIAFGLNPTSFVTQVFADFEGSSDGTTITDVLLNPGTHGWKAGIWTVNGPGAAMKFATAASKPLTNAVARLNDGSAASTSSTLGVRYLTATNQSFLKLDYRANGASPLTNSTSWSCGIWFNSDLLATDTSNFDAFTMYANAGNFCNLKFLGSGTSRIFQNESPGTSGSSSINYTTGTWVWVTIQMNKTGNNIIKVYDASGTLLGTLTETGGGSGNFGYVLIGNNNGNTPTTGFHVDFDSLKVDPAGTFPLLP